jgi:hypothetical protein
MDPTVSCIEQFLNLFSSWAKERRRKNYNCYYLSQQVEPLGWEAFSGYGESPWVFKKGHYI